jgi:hypothetical protein
MLSPPNIANGQRFTKSKYDVIGHRILKYERNNLYNIRCLSQHPQPKKEK